MLGSRSKIIQTSRTRPYGHLEQHNATDDGVLGSEHALDRHRQALSVMPALAL